MDALAEILGPERLAFGARVRAVKDMQLTNLVDELDLIERLTEPGQFPECMRGPSWYGFVRSATFRNGETYAWYHAFEATTCAEMAQEISYVLTMAVFAFKRQYVKLGLDQ